MQNSPGVECRESLGGEYLEPFDHEIEYADKVEYFSFTFQQPEPEKMGPKLKKTNFPRLQTVFYLKNLANLICFFLETQRRCGH